MKDRRKALKEAILKGNLDYLTGNEVKAVVVLEYTHTDDGIVPSKYFVSGVGIISANEYDNLKLNKDGRQ